MTAEEIEAELTEISALARLDWAAASRRKSALYLRELPPNQREQLPKWLGRVDGRMVHDLLRLPEDDFAEWAERAAIMEFDGRTRREHAESAALRAITRRIWHPMFWWSIGWEI